MNTRFFHAMIRNKRHSCHIHMIQDSSASWISEPAAMATSAVQFFQGLLSGQASHIQVLDFDFLPSLVTADDDIQLCRDSTLEEVRNVVFSIDPDSAPGPDGFCSRFYQTCWDIIADDLFATVLDFFRGSDMPRGFMSTLLVLLPKKDSPSSWVHFRLISLCNVSNKVITKLLVSRLASLLPRIISSS